MQTLEELQNKKLEAVILSLTDDSGETITVKGTFLPTLIVCVLVLSRVMLVTGTRYVVLMYRILRTGPLVVTTQEESGIKDSTLMPSPRVRESPPVPESL